MLMVQNAIRRREEEELKEQEKASEELELLQQREKMRRNNPETTESLSPYECCRPNSKQQRGLEAKVPTGKRDSGKKTVRQATCHVVTAWFAFRVSLPMDLSHL